MSEEIEEAKAQEEKWDEAAAALCGGLYAGPPPCFRVRSASRGDGQHSLKVPLKGRGCVGSSQVSMCVCASLWVELWISGCSCLDTRKEAGTPFLAR